jgi:hypothetical protein
MQQRFVSVLVKLGEPFHAKKYELSGQKYST